MNTPAPEAIAPTKKAPEVQFPTFGGRLTPLLEKKRKADMTLAQAALVYGVLKKTKTQAKFLLDTRAHTWSISDDYAGSMYRAAMRLASEAVVRLPGSRQKLSTGESYDTEGKFESIGWAWMPLAGTSRSIQVRTHYERIEFRSLAKKDLDKLRQAIVAIEEEMSLTSPLDGEGDEDEVFGHTDLKAWDKEKGRWEFKGYRRKRSFRSVMLPGSTESEILKDLHAFRSTKARMERLEMPWRRGYLLSGPPGTGKTSASAAIAGALGFTLCTLSLTDMKGDGQLRDAVSRIDGQTVLVIEDIDTYGIAQKREGGSADAGTGGLTLSGLLNALDGFETPDGLVTILTTNHPEKLDPALTRHGRIDQHFHLGYIEDTELERLFKWFYEQESPSSAPEMTALACMAPAEVAEMFKRHLDEPEAGWDAVLTRIVSATKVATQGVPA